MKNPHPILLGDTRIPVPCHVYPRHDVSFGGSNLWRRSRQLAHQRDCQRHSPKRPPSRTHPHSSAMSCLPWAWCELWGFQPVTQELSACTPEKLPEKIPEEAPFINLDDSHVGMHVFFLWAGQPLFTMCTLFRRSAAKSHWSPKALRPTVPRSWNLDWHDACKKHMISLNAHSIAKYNKQPLGMRHHAHIYVHAYIQTCGECMIWGIHTY